MAYDDPQKYWNDRRARLAFGGNALEPALLHYLKGEFGFQTVA